MARATPSLPFAWPASGWEYQDITIEYDGAWSNALDELGAEGWMLVSLIHDEGVKGDKELRAVLMRPRSGVGSTAKAEGRVKKRRSATAETGHEEIVEEDEESDEDA